MLYIKNIFSDIRIGQAVLRPSGSEFRSEAEGIPTNNQRRQRSGPCRLWGGLDKARHIVPIALLVRVQCYRKGLYKAVELPSTRPIVLSFKKGVFFVITSLFETEHLIGYSRSTCIISRSLCILLSQRKRKRSVSVLWQKPLQPQKTLKSKVTAQKRHQNFDLTTSLI